MKTYFSQLDQMRITLHFLRCLTHLSVPFMVLPSVIWPMRAMAGHSEIADGFVFLVHLGIMEIFFVLNGFFAIQMLMKNDIKHFIINRLRRIFIPFLLGMILLVPFIMTLGFSAKESLTLNDAFAKTIEIFATGTPTMAHLWSLWYLLIIYAIFLVFFQHKTNGIKVFLEKISFTKMLFVVGALALFSMFFYPRKYTLVPVNTWLEWQMILYYCAFFAFGIWAFFNIKNIEKYKISPFIFLVYLVATIGNILFQKTDNQSFIVILLGKMAYVTQALSSIFVLYFLVKKYPTSEKILRHWSPIMYWVYWIEVPIAIAVHYCFLDKINPLILVFGTTFCTFVIAYFSYQFFLKNTKIGKWSGFTN